MVEDGFYIEAATIIEAVRNKKGRVKSLCYNSKQRNKKGLFGLVSEVCKSNLSSWGRLNSLPFLAYDLLEQTLHNLLLLKSEKRGKVCVSVIE